jgi:hypothetical protein
MTRRITVVDSDVTADTNTDYEMVQMEGRPGSPTVIRC